MESDGRQDNWVGNEQLSIVEGRLAKEWEKLAQNSTNTYSTWPKEESEMVISALLKFADSPDDENLEDAMKVAAEAWSKAHDDYVEMIERLAFLMELSIRPLEDSSKYKHSVRKIIAFAAESVVTPLSVQALIDPLTGCGNRRAFQKSIEVVFSEAVRHNYPVSVVSIDLDGLKKINDQLGHAEGDKALSQLAVSMQHRMRKHEQLFRVGGDEFLAILSHSSTEDAENLMQRVKSDGAPNFSWGVATFASENITIDEIIERADADLYLRRRERRGAILDRLPEVNSSNVRYSKLKQAALVAVLACLSIAFFAAELGSGLPQANVTSPGQSTNTLSGTGTTGINGGLIGTPSGNYATQANSELPKGAALPTSNTQTNIVTSTSTSSSPGTTITSSPSTTAAGSLSPLLLSTCTTLDTLLGGLLGGSSSTTTSAC